MRNIQKPQIVAGSTRIVFGNGQRHFCHVSPHFHKGILLGHL
jgi:hypothetical protein